MSPGPASPPASAPSGNIHQNKLLGMLASVGQNGHAAPAPPHDRPQAISPPSHAQTPLGTEQQVNLLNLFKRSVTFPSLWAPFKPSDQ